MIFVNLPVADVAASTAFYRSLGMTLDPRFSNAQASAMVWSDTISFMLLSLDFYATFIDRPIADARATSAALLCLTQASRADVDAITQAALAAGGRETRPVQDHGFMYGRAFEDLDGHVVEAGWMDVDAALATMQADAEAA